MDKKEQVQKTLDILRRMHKGRLPSYYNKGKIAKRIEQLEKSQEKLSGV